MEDKLILFELAFNYQAAIKQDGVRWSLRRHTGRGKSSRMTTVCSGVILDSDPEFLMLQHECRPETPTESIRVSLALRRATDAYNVKIRPTKLSIIPEA